MRPSKQDAYWRDVGTLDSYFEANIELCGVDPLLNLYDYHWPVRTDQPNLPPPKFVFDDSGRRGSAHDSIVASGSIVSGGLVTRSILGPKTRIEECAEVTDSILLGGARIGPGAVVRRAIIDKNVDIPANARVGVDVDADRKRGFTVSEGGVVVIPKVADAPSLF